MSTLTEQFSAARKSQLEAQLNFFQHFSARAVESTEKILALNLATSRALVAKSSADALQLLTAKDPRDLFALTTQTQAGFDTLMAYGRALAGIASGAQQALLPPLAKTVAAPAPAPAAQADLAVTIEALAPAAPALAPEIAPAAVAEPLPAATVKPIAKAASSALKAVPAKPAAAPFPKADKPLVVSSLKAVEAAPPPAPVSGTPKIDAKPQPRQQDLLAPKTKKKK